MTSYSRIMTSPSATPDTVAPKISALQEPPDSAHSHAHMVQLFDAPRSLADAVSHFLIEGRAQGDHLLVIARASHWQLIRAYLERRAFPVDDPSQCMTVDARKLRARMMRRGVLDPARMEETLAPRCPSSRKGTRTSGLWRDRRLFAEKGNFEQACALEDNWNHLQDQYPFTLLCGYSAAHFCGSAQLAASPDVCSRHSSIKSQSSDTLGTWLTTR